MVSEVVLIRGLFRGTYHWGAFTKLLQGILRNKHVVCFDVPGNGYLNNERSPTTIDGMVESIRAQNQRNKKVIVVAISMGGMIGLRWAELYPDEIETLICINTTSRGFSKFYQRLLPANYFKLFSLLYSSPSKRESGIYNMVSNKRVNDDIIKDWVHFSSLYPMKKINFFRQLIAAVRYRASKPDCRVIFISSLKDKLVSHNATKVLSESWGCPLVINRVDGHDIALDNPIWLSLLIKNSINKSV